MDGGHQAMTARLFRVIVPVADLEKAAAFYEAALGIEGERVSPGRYYIDCGGTILALFDSQAEDGRESRPNPEHIHYACPKLEEVLERSKAAGAQIEEEIRTWPWGERSFQAQGPLRESHLLRRRRHAVRRRSLHRMRPPGACWRRESVGVPGPGSMISQGMRTSR
jgi:predicted enzyme related to lactoylglutathione lyase